MGSHQLHLTSKGNSRWQILKSERLPSAEEGPRWKKKKKMVRDYSSNRVLPRHSEEHKFAPLDFPRSEGSSLSTERDEAKPARSAGGRGPSITRTLPTLLCCGLKIKLALSSINPSRDTLKDQLCDAKVNNVSQKGRA